MEAIGFDGLHQAVHDGTGLITTDEIHIDQVFMTDSESAASTFSRVAAHGKITVIQKDMEVRFLIQTILQGLAGVTSGGVRMNMGMIFLRP